MILGQTEYNLGIEGEILLEVLGTCRGTVNSDGDRHKWLVVLIVIVEDNEEKQNNETFLPSMESNLVLT